MRLYFKNGKKGNLVLNWRLSSSWLSVFERSVVLAFFVFESVNRELEGTEEGIRNGFKP